MPSSSRASDGSCDDPADPALARPAIAAEPSSPDHSGWQSGRAQRVRALETALEAATLRQRQASKQPQHSDQDPDYGTMLDSESDGDGDGDSGSDNDSASDSETRTRGDGPDPDAVSCSSSVLYSEGQPLLCTYQPPAPLGTSAAPLASYGLLRAAAPVKTPETYLPWDVRLRGSLQRMCAIDCCCGPSAN